MSEFEVPDGCREFWPPVGYRNFLKNHTPGSAEPGAPRTDSSERDGDGSGASGDGGHAAPLPGQVHFFTEEAMTEVRECWGDPPHGWDYDPPPAA
jgi:hypothetical protein